MRFQEEFQTHYYCRFCYNKTKKKILCIEQEEQTIHRNLSYYNVFFSPPSKTCQFSFELYSSFNYLSLPIRSFSLMMFSLFCSTYFLFSLQSCYYFTLNNNNNNNNNNPIYSQKICHSNTYILTHKITISIISIYQTLISFIALDLEVYRFSLICAYNKLAVAKMANIVSILFPICFWLPCCCQFRFFLVTMSCVIWHDMT